MQKNDQNVRFTADALVMDKDILLWNNQSFSWNTSGFHLASSILANRMNDRRYLEFRNNMLIHLDDVFIEVRSRIWFLHNDALSYFHVEVWDFLKPGASSRIYIPCTSFPENIAADNLPLQEQQEGTI